MSHLRISLNLTHYYQDFKQFSRLYINDNIKTIGDLKKRIAGVFILDDSNFHLMCENFYLPSNESIQILDDYDLIYVLPDYGSETKTPAKKKLKNKNKFEASESQKEKILKYDFVNVETNNFNSEGDTNKKKSKRDDRDKEVDNKQKKKSKKNIENSETNEEAHAEETFLKPKRKKSKKNNHTNDNLVKDKNEETQMGVCNSNKTEECPNQVQNIAITVNVADSDASNEMCDNVDAKCRKRRRCITPLKEKRSVTCAEIFMQEKLAKNVEVTEKEQMETNSANVIVQSVEILDKEKQKELSDELENAEHRTSYALGDTIEFSSPTKSVKSNRSSFKQVLGVGETLKILISESSMHEESDTTLNSENDFVTKRKRCRVRKRKNKKTVHNSETSETKIENPVTFKPPRTVAAPKSHIKFTNDDETTDNGNLSENGFENGFENVSKHSTPIKQIIKDTGNNIIISVNNNLCLKNIDYSKYVDLTGIPSVNNVILFKQLKLDQNYAPIVSNQILAEVKEVLSNGDQLKVKLIDGLDEFRQPAGRFSCIPDEEEHDLQNKTSDNTVIIERNNLIEPKIYRI